MRKVGNIKRRVNIAIMISLKIFSWVKSLDLKSYDLYYFKDLKVKIKLFYYYYVN